MAAAIQSVRATCVRGTRTFTGRYRAFLLDPGTLFTLGSLVLLIAAIIQTLAGLTSDKASASGTPLYLAAALVGAAYGLTALTALALGAIKARDSLQGPVRNGLEFLAIVTAGTLAGVVIGVALHG